MENKSRTITHIIKGVRGPVGFKGNIGFLRFLRPLGTPGHRNFLNRSSGGFRRLHGRLNLFTGGSSAVISLAEGAVAASLFGSSSSLQRKQKETGFIQPERKKANTTKS
jgi:hypothetical protein